jgi:uracil phosphoribosyltransferase
VSAVFKTVLEEVGFILTYEATRDLLTHNKKIETPLVEMQASVVQKNISLISVLRAGNGLLEGAIRLLPFASVGHIGLSRDAETFEITEYYLKTSKDISKHDVVILDPMLATGHSAAVAIDRIKALKPKSIKFVCLLCAPEGIEYLHKKHSDVPIFTAAIDTHLNEKKYIVPGLGDAGDRLYNTTH